MKWIREHQFTSLIALLSLVLSGTVLYISSNDSFWSEQEKSRVTKTRVEYPEEQRKLIYEQFNNQAQSMVSDKYIKKAKIDTELLRLLDKRKIAPLDQPDLPTPSRFKLGHWIFFEKNLSGRRNISCAICHVPSLGSSDGMSLSVGGEGSGFAVHRHLEDVRLIVPRNSLAIFNRAQPEWERMFWDGRVFKQDDRIFSPAGKKIPDQIDSPLSATAILPLVVNKEMRGATDKKDIFGLENKLADFPDTAFNQIWDELVSRLRKEPEYESLFRKAFSEINTDEEIRIRHVGKALSSFVKVAFSSRNSPWDRYLRGRFNQLSTKAKKGANLFYGKAKCYTCHSGDLMTDQQFYNIGVPQLGPGKSKENQWDLGAYPVTGNEDDKFAFRTPPLRNVALTGPWMHNGAYKTLEGAVRHHLNPKKALKNYNKKQLNKDTQGFFQSPIWIEQLKDFPSGPPGANLVDTVRDTPEDIKRILSTLDRKIYGIPELTTKEVDQIIYFLNSLTDPKFGIKDYEKRINPSANLAKPVYRSKPRRNEYLDAIVIHGKTPSGIPTECREEWCK